MFSSSLVSAPVTAQQINALLPLLPVLAEQVREYGHPDAEVLATLLEALDAPEEWMLDELTRWAKLLNRAREASGEAMLASVRKGLIHRGIPEASAILAVDYVAGRAENMAGDTSSSPTIPIETRDSPFPMQAVVDGYASPRVQPIQVSQRVIGLGTLPTGEGGKATLIVEGGPGEVILPSKSMPVDVVPRQFGPQATELVIYVKGNGESNVLLCPLTLKSETESIEVEVLAEWKSLRPGVMEPLKLDSIPDIPRPQPQPGPDKSENRVKPNPPPPSPDPAPTRQTHVPGRWRD